MTNSLNPQNHPTFKPKQGAMLQSLQYKIKRKEKYSSKEDEPSLLVDLYLLVYGLNILSILYYHSWAPLTENLAGEKR